MTAAVDSAVTWPAPCTTNWWLFHAPDFGRSASPDPALELCAACPVLDACRRLPPPEVPGKWVVQAGEVFGLKKSKTKETVS